MGLFESLRHRFRPVRIVDPVFGPLRFQRRAGFWEGFVLFSPTGWRTEVLIDGDIQGPTEAQRRFYRQLEERYAALRAPIGALLAETLTNWRGELLYDDVWQHFTLVAIALPRQPEATAHWELSYDCALDDHSFDVQLAGWQPRGIAING